MSGGRSAQLAGIVVCAAGCGFQPSPLRPDAAIDAQPPDVIADVAPAAPPASCAALHEQDPTLASGSYVIDPDGDGADPPLSADCDMVSDGGGWTIVYLASTNNATGAPIGYTTASPQLLADAQDALLAYRDDTGSVVADFADLPLPGAWRSDTPFDAAATDASTSVSVDGGPRTSALLRFGYQSFSSRCNDAWISGGAPYGRLCIVGTRAPFFAGFASTSADTCSDSMSGYGAAACTAARRFSIAVR